MAGACVTVTARATESAAAGCDVRAVAAASTVAARLAVGTFGAVPVGGLGTVISACTFTDADEIRSRSRGCGGDGDGGGGDGGGGDGGGDDNSGIGGGEGGV
eukprot:jgi/Chrpa1/24256/Chrysochromulina_OHIO_Genome00022951-RA